MTSSSQAMTLSRSLPTLSLRRLAVTCLVVILLAPCTTVAQEPAVTNVSGGSAPQMVLPVETAMAEGNPWVATLEVDSETINVGEPFSVHVVITNRSTTEVVMPAPVGLCGRFCGLLMSGPDSPGGEESLGGLPCPAVLPFPVFMTKRTYEPGEKVAMWGTDHYPCHVGTYTFQFSCQAPESVREPQRDFKSGKTEVNSEVWTGHLASNSVPIQAVEPQGVDKQAYEAFGPGVVFDSRRYGELLGRFPTSTYAADVVWKLYVRGIISGWSNESLISFLAEDPSTDSNSVPCDIPERCGDTEWMSLQGEEFRQWRVRWLDTILEHHPNIWFADEVRLKLALDRYLLGDKDACAAGLEDLAEHGKPYVASKAGELLAAMKAKGMLGEKAK